MGLIAKKKKCPKGCNVGGEMGLRVKLESETAGHCRGHVKGLGSGPISRESIERCWVWVLWFLCIFRPLVQHSLCKTLFSLYPYHWILLQMSKLNIGDIEWLAQGYLQWLARATLQTQVCWTPEHSLSTITLYRLVLSKSSFIVCSKTSF